MPTKDAVSIEEQYNKALADIEEYRKVLAFYADRKNYWKRINIRNYSGFDNSLVQNDKGEKARQVLNKLKERKC